MIKKYTITAKNPFAVAATLTYLRVPFEFIPHKVYNDRKRPNQYNRSVFVITLEEGGRTSIADIMWAINNKWGDTFGFTIIEGEE